MNSTGQNIAIIDLGTNTFHLLIVKILKNNQWETLYRERIFVKLGEGGVDEIIPSAWSRAIKSLVHFKKIINQHNCSKLEAVGTAALRKAKNAQDFIATVRKNIGINVSVISGDLEALLITKGVTHSLPPMKNPYLIMDIGGGSVEFIYRSKENTTLFSKSYNVGVAVLFQKYHKNDPISTKEIQIVDEFLNSTTIALQKIIKSTRISLVGASGTFDVLEELLHATQISEALSLARVEGFDDVYNEIIHGSLADRLSNEMIPDARAELIVVAMQLIHFVLKNFNIQDIFISKFALKEGLIINYLD